MKAVQVSQYGGSEAVEVNEVLEPFPKQDQVLVEVYAASINPFDIKLASGIYKDSISLELPFTFGGDFSGVIIDSGEEVFGSASVLSGGSGAFAQKLIANTKNISLKPKKIDFIEVAALPLVGSSAIQALEENIKLKKGQKILIHGGAGGIGSIAIQLAKHLGAIVATTVSTEDKEFVKNLGADQIIDYKKERFELMLSDFDAVYDLVGGETTDKSFKVLKQGGILVSMLGKPDEELAEKYQITVIGQNTKTNKEHLSRLAELVDQGVIKPQVDKVFPLEQIKEAIDYFKQNHPQGKVVIKVGFEANL